MFEVYDGLHVAEADYGEHEDAIQHSFDNEIHSPVADDGGGDAVGAGDG